VHRLDSDLHADTVCAGSAFTFRQLSGTGVVCEVKGFKPEMGTCDNVEVLTTGTAYDDKASGENIILVFDQSLLFGSSLQTSLSPPNQIRAAGHVVDDVPRQFTQERSLHVIHFPEEKLTIPFQLRVMMSYIATRFPTEE